MVEEFGRSDGLPMSNEPNAMEQAVTRALRDSLERLQRNSEELHHAVSDVVSACSSNKPANAFSPLLRAQTSAASLNAALEVLSRFIAATLQPGARSPFESEIARIAAAAPKEAVVVESAPTQVPVPLERVPVIEQQVGWVEHHAPVVEQHGGLEAAGAASRVHENAQKPEATAEIEPEGSSDFNVARLSSEEQELHRRANRVAKVSMQDIKMLHPEQVRLGRENKDLCIRLKDDIEKAHREYDRRFKPIMDHPVDYFYRWMVEILAEGDAGALGEYPYAVPVHKQ
jgi:hypothetical protein